MTNLGRGDTEAHCRRCNAGLAYAPGATVITCRYCGEEQPIAFARAAPAQAAASYHELLRAAFAREPRADAQIVRCEGCGAETTRPVHVLSERCPFCASPALSAGGGRLRAPDGVLPFSVDAARAREAVEAWERGLWFKPSALFTEAPEVRPLYLPYWSFDWDVTTDYVRRPNKGADEQGRDHTRLAGSTVLASRSVPPMMGADLEPWDLDGVVAFNPQLLLGVTAETHGELDGLSRGAALSHRLLDREVDYKIRPGTGSQRATIVSRSTTYHGVRYRLLLLPVWIASYAHQGRVHRVLVNGRSGEVVGERPVSVIRVARMFLAPFALPLVAGAFAGLGGGGMSFWLTFWGALAAQSILILITKGGKVAAPARHGQFFLKREGARGTEDLGELMSALMQNEPHSRSEIWRFFGFIGLFVSIGPVVSLWLYAKGTFPVPLVIGFHLFSAVVVLGVYLGYLSNMKEKRALLGDP